MAVPGNAEISASRARGPLLDPLGCPAPNPSRAATIPAIPTPQLREARQTARSTPRRAATLPGLRTPLGPLSPGVATTAPGTLPPRPSVPDSPSRRTRAFGMPSSCPRRSSPGMRSSPRAAPPAEALSRPRRSDPPSLRPHLCAPSPPPPGASGRFAECPGAGPWRLDGPTDVPVRHLRVQTPACQRPPPEPSGSGVPTPPRRPVRTFRSSLGRPGGSAHRPPTRLRTCVRA